MKYFDGFLFCHTPIVDPEGSYDCKHFISINLYPEHCPPEQIPRAAEIGTDEWNNCVKIIEIPDGDHFPVRSATLNQEVIDWLNENIADSTDKNRSDMPQGWMIYDPMLIHQTIDVSVFFLRKVDAMAFKLRWE